MRERKVQEMWLRNGKVSLCNRRCMLEVLRESIMVDLRNAQLLGRRGSRANSYLAPGHAGLGAEKFYRFKVERKPMEVMPAKQVGNVIEMDG